MYSGLIEDGPFEVRGEYTIQPLRFKFSNELKKLVKEGLKNAKYDIALARYMPVPTNYRTCLKNMIKFWAKDYNFRKQENFFNKYPNFRITIDEIDIHYVHVKPIRSFYKDHSGKKNIQTKKIVPLLMLHGWPSSVIEFYNAIPYLTDGSDTKNLNSEINIVFEVIIPSLPGFGGSTCPMDQNFDWRYIAELLVKFMNALNHKKFYVHCDDWCAFVVYEMTQLHPDKLWGVHYGLCQVKEMTDLKTYLADRFANSRAKRAEEEILKDGYYDSPASLCLLTLGMALMNSPTALIAYLFEKFVKDSIHPDAIDNIEKYERVTFLNNVMMYWATKSILSSLKAYQKFTINGCLYERDFEDNSEVFTAITLFIPWSVRQYKVNMRSIQNVSVSYLCEEASFRCPALEKPKSFANDMICHFMEHRRREGLSERTDN